MIRAGKLRHRVSVQKLTAADQPDGTYSESWVEQTKRWASIEPLKGREYLEAEAVNADIDHRIVIRPHAGVAPKNYRITNGTRVFNIVSVANIEERDTRMELMCKEAV